MARISPKQVALLLELMRRRREEETGRTTTRYRVSASTLRTISGRSRLRDAFLDELMDAMIEIGWLIIPSGDNFGVLSSDAIESWPRIASRRIRQELSRANDPDADRFFAELEREVAPQQEMADEED